MPGPGKPFKKGNKASPGRPVIPVEFKEKCRDFTDSVVFEKWKAEVTSDGVNWMRAAEMLAAYGYGKPHQSVDLGNKDGKPLSVQIIRKVAK